MKRWHKTSCSLPFETWKMKLKNETKMQALFIWRLHFEKLHPQALCLLIVTNFIWIISAHACYRMISVFRETECSLTIILLTWRIWWAPNNANIWQRGFNSAFKELRFNRDFFFFYRIICRDQILPTTYIYIDALFDLNNKGYAFQSSPRRIY